MSLRIAFISEPDDYSRSLCKALTELNHDVESLTSKLGLPRIFQLLLQKRPQVIHLNHQSKFLMGLLPEIIKSALNIPVVTTFHELAPPTLINKIKLGPLLSGSDAFTVCEDFYKNRLNEYLPQKHLKKIEVIHEGCSFNLNFLNIKSSPASERERWGMQSADRVMGYNGPLTEEGGFLSLVKTFAKLRKTDNGIKLFVMSSWGSTPLPFKQSILSFIEKEQLQNHIVFAGVLTLEDLWKAMDAVDLCIYPSKNPAQSSAIRQSLFKGLPILTQEDQILDFFKTPDIAQKLSEKAMALRPTLGFESVANEMSRLYSRLT